MSNWRAMADDALRGRDTRDNRDARAAKSGDPGASVPTVPNVPAPISALKLWRSSLAGVDPCEPRGRFTMARWQTLYDASLWWLEGFAKQAALDGWSTGDLFGIHPLMPGAGGLIDRIGDNRSLVMTADHAVWRSFGVAETYNRTSGVGLVPWWEGME